MHKILYDRHELNNIILKSIKQNQTIEPEKLVIISCTRIAKMKSLTKQSSTCIITGRRGGFFKKYQLSRHAILKNCLFGKLQGLKVASW